MKSTLYMILFIIAILVGIFLWSTKVYAQEMDKCKISKAVIATGLKQDINKLGLECEDIDLGEDAQLLSRKSNLVYPERFRYICVFKMSQKNLGAASWGYVIEEEGKPPRQELGSLVWFKIESSTEIKVWEDEMTRKVLKNFKDEQSI